MPRLPFGTAAFSLLVDASIPFKYILSKELPRRPPTPFSSRTLAVWKRYKVTICIAAFAEIEEQLVFVADSRVAFGDFSTDKGAVKAEILANGYVVLIAGNDIVYALPTIRRGKLRVESSGTFDADEVAEILQGELCKTREQVPQSYSSRSRYI